MMQQILAEKAEKALDREDYNKVREALYASEDILRNYVNTCQFITFKSIALVKSLVLCRLKVWAQAKIFKAFLLRIDKQSLKNSS